MHSAWLEQPNGDWQYAKSHTEVLDHQGQFIVCDDQEDELTVANKVASLTGKYAIMFDYNNCVIVSDTPIFNNICDDAVRLAQKGVGVKIISHADKYCRTEVTVGKQSVQIYHRDPRRCWPMESPSFAESFESFSRGLVFLDDETLVFDLKLWGKATTIFKRRETKKHEASLISKGGMEAIADKLAASLCMGGVKEFRCEQLLTWILASDQINGRRATNKIISEFARVWRKNAKHHIKHYSRWINDEVLERLDQRLKKVRRASK